MADDEVLNRAAEVNEQFRRIELTDVTVTRPAGAHTSTVHAFLRHLRDQGLACVPEPLSLAGGTETLRFIEGESGGDGWKHQHDERGLRSAARLLRRIHDASADWVPPDDAIFAAPPTGRTEVFAHGDPGPWNFVWREGEAVALIDWDFLHPAPRLSDVAYALHWFAPFRDDRAAIEWHHFPQVPDRRARAGAFLDSYGMAAHVDVVDAVVERIRYTSEHARFLADQGQEPQRTWVAEGSVERERRAEVAWIEANRELLAG
ncbi:aminoglycoside phosphotransferase (APT) family kinase protein [Nocardioides cavernae]|uniref:Aminoglycoside phosphotransferase (APT) family kinase protein n=1 Tax=Nocardioides cavernae TaxID=1921566 RepID=A0A7Y9H324_9ACTN|nr:aminoglycoside phosphotransferase family protein [Nocardioides cavernae]NYE37039.1 aminoglycoside phosphotransferase (APT) family kinase protein [Nocardioides cavernae]